MENSTVSSTLIISNVVPGKEYFDKDDFTGEDMNKIRETLIYQLSCPSSPTGICTEPTNDTPNDCGANTDYCSRPECIKKIVCCHEISEGVFNIMTANGTSGHALFTSDQVNNIMSNADCNIHRLKFSVSGSNYTIAKEPKPDPDSPDFVYYSVALLKGIVDKGIESIVLYKGIVTDNNGNIHKIIPFKVHYSQEPVKYYDISDSNP